MALARPAGLRADLPPAPGTHAAGVIAARGGPAGLIQLRSRGSGGDVHLVGGPQTIQAFQQLGALDRLEILCCRSCSAAGIPLFPQGAEQVRLRLLRADRTFPDGTAELVYTPA